MTRLLTLLILVSLSTSNLAADKPQRIASMSLCSDELLLLLADPDKIVSLSYLAADPLYSSFSDNISGIHLNRGQAEEIVTLEPDLILSSQFSASSAINLLQNFGYAVTNLGFPTTLESTFQQIEEVAALIGEQERGRNLIQQIQIQIDNNQATFASKQNLTAMFYANNGFSFGSNTLRNDFLTSLGLKNIAAEQGLVGFGKLSIETLISENPDFLLVNQAGLHDEKLAQPLLQHPALQQQFHADKIIVIPDTLFQCAGPSLIEAYEIMIQALSNFQ